MLVVNKATAAETSRVLENFQNEVNLQVYGTGTFTVSLVGGIGREDFSLLGFINEANGEKVTKITTPGLYYPLILGTINYLKVQVESVSGGDVSVRIDGL